MILASTPTDCQCFYGSPARKKMFFNKIMKKKKGQYCSCVEVVSCDVDSAILLEL